LLAIVQSTRNPTEKQIRSSQTLAKWKLKVHWATEHAKQKYDNIFPVAGDVRSQCFALESGVKKGKYHHINLLLILCSPYLGIPILDNIRSTSGQYSWHFCSHECFSNTSPWHWQTKMTEIVWWR
jgi:hypothetical protein